MTDRPWTVYVLVAASVAGLAFGLIADGDRNLWDVVSGGVTLLLAWGMWTARPWAFSVSFMLASLCLVLIVGVAFAQLFLFEMSLSAFLLWPGAISALWVGLLLHPSTKSFAGLPSRRRRLEA